MVERKGLATLSSKTKRLLTLRVGFTRWRPLVWSPKMTNRCAQSTWPTYATNCFELVTHLGLFVQINHGWGPKIVWGDQREYLGTKRLFIFSSRPRLMSSHGSLIGAANSAIVHLRPESVLDTRGREWHIKEQQPSVSGTPSTESIYHTPHDQSFGFAHEHSLRKKMMVSIQNASK